MSSPTSFDASFLALCSPEVVQHLNWFLEFPQGQFGLSIVKSVSSEGSRA